MNLIAVVDYFSKNPRKLFLVDALGAVLTAFMLGIVLMQFEAYFGIPKEILLYFAIAPCLFAIFSFFSYLRKRANWRALLRIIAVLNLAYCLASFSLLFVLANELSALGFTYLIGEIIIIMVLVLVEFKTANT